MKDYKLKSGNILRVIQDESPESPNIWGNEDIFLVYDHRQFCIKREGFKPKDIFDALNEGLENEEGYYTNYFIFPVDAYIHSGVHLSLANTKDYPDRRWDVSTAGYILVDKNDIDFDLNRKNKEERKDKTDEELARIFAEGLIETWNQYLSGDVWGFKVLKKRNIKSELVYNLEQGFLKEGFEIPLDIISNSLDKDLISELQSFVEYEEIDSCWGFYGSDPKTNGMLDNINDEIVEENGK